MAATVNRELWQLRDAYGWWCLHFSSVYSRAALWDYFQLCFSLRARRSIKRGGR